MRKNDGYPPDHITCLNCQADLEATIAEYPRYEWPNWLDLGYCCPECERGEEFQIFHTEYQNEIPRPHPYIKYVEEYHRLCDQFDGGLCPPNGKPKTNRDAAQMNSNAKSVVRMIANRMFGLGLGVSQAAAELMLREIIREIPRSAFK